LKEHKHEWNNSKITSFPEFLKSLITVTWCSSEVRRSKHFHAHVL